MKFDSEKFFLEIKKDLPKTKDIKLAAPYIVPGIFFWWAILSLFESRSKEYNFFSRIHFVKAFEVAISDVAINSFFGILLFIITLWGFLLIGGVIYAFLKSFD